MAGKKTKKVHWLSSTMIVLLILFLIGAGVGIGFYGWRRVLDESLFYLIGATFTGFIVAVVGIIFKRYNIRLW